MKTNKIRCPICNLHDQEMLRNAKTNLLTFKCLRCGIFTVTGSIQNTAYHKNVKPKLSGWIRNIFELGMEPPEISKKSVAEITNSIPDYNPSDKQYLFLRNISRKSRYPGDGVSLRPSVDYPLAWASAPEELLFYIRFLIERELLLPAGNLKNSATNSVGEDVSVAVSAKGWDYLDKYEQRAIELSQAFVAVSSTEPLNKVWEKAIKPALNDAGYKASRIYTEHHRDEINAKTIAEIKNSLFVVADVTENKRVVYFAAGYAIGRNLPVIWSVRKDCLHDVHFDTRQYNHVVWETAEELKEKLYDIVCALVGRRKKI